MPWPQLAVGALAPVGAVAPVGALAPVGAVAPVGAAAGPVGSRPFGWSTGREVGANPGF